MERFNVLHIVNPRGVITMGLLEGIDVKAFFQKLSADIKEHDPQDGTLGDIAEDRKRRGPVLPYSDSQGPVCEEGGDDC